MLKNWKVILATLGLSAGLAIPGWSETGITDNEIILGVPNALSGNNEFSGKQTSIGVRAYVDEINAKGGINGRKIRVVSCDDRYEVDGAFQCFQKMQKENVFALTGLVGSALLAKYIPMCTNAKMPAVGFYSGPQFVGSPPKHYIFTLRLGYRDEEQQLIDHLWNECGIRKFGIIYQNDSYGADHLEGMKAALKAHNSNVVAAASYKRLTTAIDDAFNKVREANPDVVSLAANHRQCVEIIKKALQVGWNPIFFINSGANIDGFIPEAGKSGEGILVSETVPSANRSDVPLIAKYQKALKQSSPAEKPCFTSLRGYLDALVVCEGIRRCGKDPTREKFVSELEKMKNVDLGLGKGLELTYGPNDHWGLHKYQFGTVHNGDVVPVTDWKKLKKH